MDSRLCIYVVGYLGGARSQNIKIAVDIVQQRALTPEGTSDIIQIFRATSAHVGTVAASFSPRVAGMDLNVSCASGPEVAIDMHKPDSRDLYGDKHQIQLAYKPCPCALTPSSRSTSRDTKSGKR
jgi:hypothetical protein